MQKKKEPPKENKPGLFDRLWSALIRPQNRIKYSTSDLGPSTFTLDSITITRREDFQITNSRGNILYCSYFEPIKLQNKPHPVVFYLHGNASSRLESLSLLEYIIPYEMALACLDFQGCGMSGGEYISLGFFEKMDASLVIDWVKKNKRISSIGIWGRSMGAATSIMLASIRDDIDFIVADSSFTSIKTLSEEVALKQYKFPKFVLKIAYYFIRKKVKKKANFDLNDCDVLNAIKQIKHKPSILFLAAKEDQLINYHHSKEIFESFQGSKQILLFEGNHNTRRPKKILQQVSTYLQSVLLNKSQQQDNNQKNLQQQQQPIDLYSYSKSQIQQQQIENQHINELFKNNHFTNGNTMNAANQNKGDDIISDPEDEIAEEAKSEINWTINSNTPNFIIKNTFNKINNQDQQTSQLIKQHELQKDEQMSNCYELSDMQESTKANGEIKTQNEIKN